MSWSLTVPAFQASTFNDTVTAARAAYAKVVEANDVDLDPAANAQIDTAIASAKAIVESGNVGSGLISLTLSGHANPEHKPVKGWANDSVSVVVYNADPQPTT